METNKRKFNELQSSDENVSDIETKENDIKELKESIKHEKLVIQGLDLKLLALPDRSAEAYKHLEYLLVKQQSLRGMEEKLESLERDGETKLERTLEGINCFTYDLFLFVAS